MDKQLVLKTEICKDSLKKIGKGSFCILPSRSDRTKINIRKLSKDQEVGEYLWRMVNIPECLFGIETTENALQGHICPWPPPQSSKAILNHFSEHSRGAEILCRLRQMTDHGVSCQSKIGEDTESEFMTLN